MSVSRMKHKVQNSGDPGNAGKTGTELTQTEYNHVRKPGPGYGGMSLPAAQGCRHESSLRMEKGM